MPNQVISVTSVDNAISNIRRFRKNWDGCNSPAVKIKVVKTLENILRNLETHRMPFPKIIPTPGGGVAMGWTSHYRDVELEISPGGIMEFTFNLKKYNPTGELQEETTSSGNLTGSDGVDYVMVWFLTDSAGDA